MPIKNWFSTPVLPWFRFDVEQEDTSNASVPCPSVHHFPPLKQHGADCLSPAVHWNLVVAAGRHVVADLAVVVANRHVADLVAAADSVAVVATLRVVAGLVAAVNGSCQRHWHNSCHNPSGTVPLSKS